MAYAAAIAGDSQEGTDRKRKAQHIVSDGNRMIKKRARESITYFELRCEQAGRVVGYKTLKRTILRLAEDRRRLYLKAAKVATNSMPKSGFKAQMRRQPLKAS